MGQDNGQQSSIMNSLPLAMATGLFAIQKFEIGQEPKEWLEIFESSVTLLQITDKDKLNLVQTYLAQEVRSWFFNREFTKWTEFKEALCERFAAKRSSKKATFRKLLDMKRLKHESISEYVDRFEDLRMAHIKDTKKDTKTTRLSDNDLLETFVNGLRPSFLKLIVKQNHPSTLNEAKRIVKEIEEDEEESLDESQEEELMSRAYEENGHDGYTSAITKMKLKNNEQPKNYAKMANKDNNTRREPVEQMDSNTESDNNFQRTMEKLANSVQNLTLLVESQNTARKPTQNTCYNCQEVGHSAKDCTQPCKLCHGQKGNHSYWNCELYSPTRNRRNGFQPKVTNESHLVITMSDNEGQMETNAITNESYAAQKRDATSSANEHERKSRSGKRVKAHDTIPENHPIRLKKQNNVGAVGYQNPTVMPSTEPAPKKTKPRKRKPGVEPIEVESVKPAEILQAPVHQCSLGQLMAIPGLRTELFKMTRKKQKNPRSKIQTMQFFEDSFPQGIIKAKQVKGGGAPRTEVLVGGTVKLDAILDGGASSCIMSSKLVKALNIETLEPAESIHGMADGRSSRPLGEVKGLVVNIQGLNVVIDAVVYELVAYDLLLGSDVLHTLGIFTDWATHFWSMKTPEGTTPLKVHYQMAGKFDQLDSTDCCRTVTDRS